MKSVTVHEQQNKSVSARHEHDETDIDRRGDKIWEWLHVDKQQPVQKEIILRQSAYWRYEQAQ